MIVALLVCLIPTTIGGLLSAIGIAGMDRLIRHNVIPTSGRAVEAAGDVDVILLDKTGTITLGNRMATEFIPCAGVSRRGAGRRRAARQLADETPEGRSIVVLAKERYGLRERQLKRAARAEHAAPVLAGGPPAAENLPEEGVHFVPFSAQTRMSGCDIAGRVVRKGAADAVARHVSRRSAGGCPPRSSRSSASACWTT